jgi:hypothetical protein
MSWIVIAGSARGGGFSFYGPLATYEEAMAAGRMIGIMHDGDGSQDGVDGGDCWWSLELSEPEAVEQASEISTDADEGPDWPAMYSGAAAVFDGDLCNEWRFFGPFAGMAAARMFARSMGFGRKCVIRLLKPFTKEHVRRAEENAATA